MLEQNFVSDQMQTDKTFLVVPFEYLQTQVSSQGDYGHCSLYSNIDYKCSNLVYQTQSQGTQCSKDHRVWKVNGRPTVFH